MNDVGYIDPRTQARYALDRPRWRSDTGGPLLIEPLPGIGRAGIERSVRSIWRYARAFPLEVAAPISMGEGCTPLVERRWHGARALLKLEWFAPTGSFKDRGASVMLSVLRQQGVTRVLEDSSGNGGAAVAAYAVAGGLEVKILVPASTQPAKIVQMKAVGAEVELVPGSRQDCADEAERQAARIFYASHNWQSWFLQGTKTLAYELWEDLGFEAPDNVIVPMGAGSNVLGCSLGFGELLRRGEIARLPRIFGVQPANCSPIVASFAAGVETPVACEIKPTVAEGTAIAKPIRLMEVLRALRESRGAAIAVGEDEIIAALKGLAAMGFYVEPTSAQPAAALSKLLAVGAIEPEQRTVLVLTGSGLKATQRIAELVGVAL
jgi:threonine synthase